MNNENIVYVKIKNGIFKCYKSEQMHKPIYYPVESKTNGYIDYNDVEKILTIEDLYKENQELKLELSGYRQAILKDKEMLGLKEENDKLKKQLEYLRSGEYYNQLRFENEMLQQVVDTNGVPSEVYDYIDCTHRNTELLEENQELKKQLEEYDRKLFITKNELDMRQKSIDNKLNQQKEFIEYLEKTIVDSKAGSGQQYYFQEILSNYKEIIGENK